MGANQKTVKTSSKTSSKRSTKKLTASQRAQLKRRKRNFWSDGLSIDETKISCLVLCLLLSMAFVGISYWKYHDISNNLADIVIALIYAVASINVASSLDNLMNNRNNMKMKQMQMDHELDMQELANSTNSVAKINNDGYIDI